MKQGRPLQRSTPCERRWYIIQKVTSSIPLYTQFGEKSICVGQMDSEQVFHKTVQLKQRLCCLDAYGLDLSYVEQLKALGCRTLELREKDTQKVFRVPFDLLWKKAIRKRIGAFPVRLYLPMKEWEEIGKPPVRTPLPALPLGLF